MLRVPAKTMVKLEVCVYAYECVHIYNVFVHLVSTNKPRVTSCDKSIVIETCRLLAKRTGQVLRSHVVWDTKKKKKNMFFFCILFFKNCLAITIYDIQPTP